MEIVHRVARELVCEFLCEPASGRECVFINLTKLQRRFQAFTILRVNTHAFHNAILNAHENGRANHIFRAFDERCIKAFGAWIGQLRRWICVGNGNQQCGRGQFHHEMFFKHLMAVVTIFAIKHDNPSALLQIRGQWLLNQRRQWLRSQRLANPLFHLRHVIGL